MKALKTRVLGPFYEDGLNSLKQVVESQPTAMPAPADSVPQ